MINMAENWQQELEKYVSDGFTKIGGWVVPGIHESVAEINRIQYEAGIMGDIAEIGVYQGRFFFMMHCLRRKSEVSVAVDLFSKQSLNIDGSGKASLDIFMSNIRDFCPDRNKVIVKECDSSVLRAEDLLSLSPCKGYRLFSVDGGHTVQHTLNDLSLAAGVVSEGGVIFLDDYYNPEWPGVHEGFTRFMLFMNRNLAPFAYLHKKLMITTISHHEMYRRKLLASIKNRAGLMIKEVTMSGFPALCIRPVETSQ